MHLLKYWWTRRRIQYRDHAHLDSASRAPHAAPLKFPKPWPLSAEFPTHLGYKPSQGTRELIEAET